MTTRTKLIIGAPLCLLGGIALVIGGLQEMKVEKSLAEGGSVVQGRVIDSAVHSGRRGRKTYKITAIYGADGGESADGGVYQKEFSVSPKTYEKYKDGGSIPIRYLASNPTAAQVEGEGGEAVGHVLGGGVLAIAGTVMGLFLLKKRTPVAAAT